jgi:hypothetical protein
MTCPFTSIHAVDASWGYNFGLLVKDASGEIKTWLFLAKSIHWVLGHLISLAAHRPAEPKEASYHRSTEILMYTLPKHRQKQTWLKHQITQIPHDGCTTIITRKSCYPAPHSSKSLVVYSSTSYPSLSFATSVSHTMPWPAVSIREMHNGWQLQCWWNDKPCSIGQAVKT